MTLIRCEPIGQEGKLNKEVVWVFLFAISIPVWYLNLISAELSGFQETLELRSTSGIPIYLTTFSNGLLILCRCAAMH